MANPAFKLTACTGQHLGDRTEQQDRVGIFTARRMPGSALFVLADGMGGKTGGAMAAQQVISTAKSLFEEFSPLQETPQQLLHDIVTESHTVIRLAAMSAEQEPHSTLVALLIQPDCADWVHVGDSRLYHFSQEKLLSRTIDHSYVERLVALGKLQASEAKYHKQANVLTSALGMAIPPTPTFGHVDHLNQGESFLLCSDGLWHYLEDQELGQILSAASPRPASEQMIAIARERAQGQGDNCTLAIAKFEAVAPPPAFPYLRS